MKFLSTTSPKLFNTITLSPLLKRMEGQVLLTRTRPTTDERTVIVQLSAKGKALKTKAASMPQDIMNSGSSSSMTSEELKELREMLCR